MLGLVIFSFLKASDEFSSRLRTWLALMLRNMYSGLILKSATLLSLTSNIDFLRNSLPHHPIQGLVLVLCLAMQALLEQVVLTKPDILWL